MEDYSTRFNDFITASQEQEVTSQGKKYGDLVPKKKPLISKDHARAFFDSADWALCKQGAQTSTIAIENLQPKLQRTPHQQLPLEDQLVHPEKIAMLNEPLKSFTRDHLCT